MADTADKAGRGVPADAAGSVACVAGTGTAAVLAVG